jgi:outer membrane immunogenic protein
VIVTPALAADEPQQAAAETSHDWTGVYLGINGAGIFGQSDWNDLDAKPKPKGGLIGGTAGFNWQFMGPWVIGLEGDGAWADASGSDGCGEDIDCETKSSWLATVRGRVGYAWNPLMPYVTGGMAVGDIEANRTGFAGANDTNVGWAAGVGGEGTLGPHWTVKIEFLYVDLGDLSCSAGACGTATKIDLQDRIIRGGLNYRF